MKLKPNDDLPVAAINYLCPLRRHIWNMFR